MPTGLRVTTHLFSRRLIPTICFLLALGSGAYGGEPARTVPLWRAVPAPASPDQPALPKKPWLLREQEIAIDGTLVQILKDATARPLPPIAIDLFDTGRYELDVISTLARNNDTSFVRGQLKLLDSGEFSLVLNGATVTGTLHLGRRVFKIESPGNGRHRLIEIDPEQESKE